MKKLRNLKTEDWLKSLAICKCGCRYDFYIICNKCGCVEKDKLKSVRIDE